LFAGGASVVEFSITLLTVSRTGTYTNSVIEKGKTSGTVDTIMACWAKTLVTFEVTSFTNVSVVIKAVFTYGTVFWELEF